ncbi:MAG: polysaccharide transporter [Candidatus Altiarchaeota archaeon]
MTDDVGVLRFNASDELPPDKARFYITLPITVRAVKVDAPFSVQTMEGVCSGGSGDYLVEGIRGELYPCSAEIFQERYGKQEDIGYSPRVRA